MEIIELPPSTMIANRFRLIYNIVFTPNVSVYWAEDTILHGHRVIVKMIPRRLVNEYNEEINCLKALEGDGKVQVDGFPHLLQSLAVYIESVQMYCIVMSYQGQSFASLLERRNGTFLMSNLVKIAYRVVLLLEKVHKLGYVHRDVHRKNIMIDSDFRGELVVSLIDFGQSRKSIPPPRSTGPGVWHTSYHVYGGGDYTPFDDFVSLSYIMMISANINPFGRNRAAFLERKLEFHANPMPFFTRPNTQWLGEFYTAIVNQREIGYNLSNIIHVLENAIRGVNPREPISYIFHNGQFFIY